MLTIQSNYPEEYPITIQTLNDTPSSELYVVLFYVNIYNVFVIFDVPSGLPLIASVMTYAGPLPQQPTTLLSTIYGALHIPGGNIVGYRLNNGAVDQSVSTFDGINNIIKSYIKDNQIIRSLGKRNTNILFNFTQETSMLQNLSVSGSTTTSGVTSLIPPFSLLSVPTAPTTTVSIPQLNTSTLIVHDTLESDVFSATVPLTVPALPIIATATAPAITQPSVSSGPGTLHLDGLNTGFTQAAQFGYTTTSTTSPYTFSDSLENFLYPGGTIRVYLFALVNAGAQNADATLTVTGVGIPGMGDGERKYTTAAQQALGTTIPVCFKFVLTPVEELVYGTVLHYSIVGSNINKFLYVFGYYDSVGGPHLAGSPTVTMSPITASAPNISGTSSPYTTTLTTSQMSVSVPNVDTFVAGTTSSYSGTFTANPVTTIVPQAGVNILGSSSGTASLASSVTEPVIDVYHIKMNAAIDPSVITGGITIGLNRSGI